MASYKITFAKCRGACGARLFNDGTCRGIAEAFDRFGDDPTKLVGVWGGQLHTETFVRATLVVRTARKYMEPSGDAPGHLDEKIVTDHRLIGLALWPKRDHLEVYGTPADLEIVTLFLDVGLMLATVTDPLALDLLALVDKAVHTLPHAVLKTAKVADVALNSYMIGAYAPKFTDTDHGLKFLNEYADDATAATIRFAASSKPATVTLTPTGSVTFTCHEDDRDEVLGHIRGLVGVVGSLIALQELARATGMTIDLDDGATVAAATGEMIAEVFGDA